MLQQFECFGFGDLDGGHDDTDTGADLPGAVQRHVEVLDVSAVQHGLRFESIDSFQERRDLRGVPAQLSR